MSSGKWRPFCLGLNVLWEPNFKEVTLKHEMLILCGRAVPTGAMKIIYLKISNIRSTEFKILNVSHLVLQLSLPNQWKPGAK